MISAVGSVFGGMQAAQQSRAQAQLLDRQAQMTFQQGEYQAGKTQDNVDRTIGQQIAAVGGSGVTLAGSPTDVIASTASEGALDTGAIRWGARVNAQNFEYQAAQERRNATSQVIGGVLGGAGQLATGFTRIGQPYGYGYGSPYRPGL